MRTLRLKSSLTVTVAELASPAGHTGHVAQGTRASTAAALGRKIARRDGDMAKLVEMCATNPAARSHRSVRACTIAFATSNVYVVAHLYFASRELGRGFGGRAGRHGAADCRPGLRAH